MTHPAQLEQITSDADETEDGPATPSMAEVEENLNVLALSPRLPAYTKTRNVRQQFQFAFELIGGIPRLAHWAHQHPDKFYALYSKLIPAQVTGEGGGPIRVQLSWLNARDTSGRDESNVIDLIPQETNGTDGR